MAEGGLPSPPGRWYGGGERPAPWRGPFIACFVLLWEEAELRTEVDGENLGLGFGNRRLFSLAMLLSLQGKKNRMGYTDLVWFECVCMCVYMCVSAHVHVCRNAPACVCVHACEHVCA